MKAFPIEQDSGKSTQIETIKLMLIDSNETLAFPLASFIFDNDSVLYSEE
jgi:hypothetical protein